MVMTSGENSAVFSIDGVLYTGSIVAETDENMQQTESLCTVGVFTLNIYVANSGDGTQLRYAALSNPQISLKRTLLLSPWNLTSSGAGDTPDFKGKFAADSEGSGSLVILNLTREDMYTWELSCNFDMQLIVSGSEGSMTIDSVMAEGWYQWRVSHPLFTQGRIKSRTSVQVDFKNRSVPPPDSDPACRINQMPITFEQCPKVTPGTAQQLTSGAPAPDTTIQTAEKASGQHPEFPALLPPP